MKDFTAARKARISEIWLSVKLNDREPYRFRSTLPADAKGWLGDKGLVDDENTGFDVIVELVHPDDRDNFKADCRTEDPAYGIDSITLSEVNQWLMGVYAGRPTEQSTPSSVGLPPTGPG